MRSFEEKFDQQLSGGFRLNCLTPSLGLTTQILPLSGSVCKCLCLSVRVVCERACVSVRVSTGS